MREKLKVPKDLIVTLLKLTKNYFIRLNLSLQKADHDHENNSKQKFFLTETPQN